MADAASDIEDGFDLIKAPLLGHHPEEFVIPPSVPPVTVEPRELVIILLAQGSAIRWGIRLRNLSEDRQLDLDRLFDLIHAESCSKRPEEWRFLEDSHATNVLDPVDQHLE